MPRPGPLWMPAPHRAVLHAWSVRGQYLREWSSVSRMKVRGTFPHRCVVPRASSTPILTGRSGLKYAAKLRYCSFDRSSDSACRPRST